MAKYWPNVVNWTPANSYEILITNRIIPIPIDQRYGIDDIYLITDIIRSFV